MNITLPTLVFKKSTSDEKLALIGADGGLLRLWIKDLAIDTVSEADSHQIKILKRHDQKRYLATDLETANNQQRNIMLYSGKSLHEGESVEAQLVFHGHQEKLPRYRLPIIDPDIVFSIKPAIDLQRKSQSSSNITGNAGDTSLLRRAEILNHTFQCNLITKTNDAEKYWQEYSVDHLIEQAINIQQQLLPKVTAYFERTRLGLNIDLDFQQSEWRYPKTLELACKKSLNHAVLLNCGGRVMIDIPRLKTSSQLTLLNGLRSYTKGTRNISILGISGGGIIEIDTDHAGRSLLDYFSAEIN